MLNELLRAFNFNSLLGQIEMGEELYDAGSEMINRHNRKSGPGALRDADPNPQQRYPEAHHGIMSISSPGQLSTGTDPNPRPENRAENQENASENQDPESEDGQGNSSSLANFFEMIKNMLSAVLPSAEAASSESSNSNGAADSSNSLNETDKTTPLILDLDGDGVEAGGSAFFDHNGDGFHELTRWVGADDGLLAWDRNNNGSIDDGGELFGNHTRLNSGENATDGFHALRDLDRNNDRVINSLDADWSSLRVLRWTDSDGDGRKDIMKLVSLASLGITSLGTVASRSSHTDVYGNEHRLTGTYTTTGGGTKAMHDVWFQTSRLVTTYSGENIPAHSDAIKALPEVMGVGKLYNFRDAMALDDAGNLPAPFYGAARTETRTLRQLVDAFKLETASAVNRDVLVEKILLRWAGAEGVTAADYRHGWASLTHTTAQKIAVVEAFRGFLWREGQSNRDPSALTAQKIENLYESYLEYLWTALMLQTHLVNVVNAIEVTTDEESGERTFDFSGIVSLGGTDGIAHKSLLRVFSSIGHAEWFIEQIANSAPSLRGTMNFHALAEFRGELLRGGTADDVLNGEDGVADQFDANAGGNDILYGKGGNDVYWLGRDTDLDTISESYFGRSDSGDNGDMIALKPGLTAADVRISRDAAHLYISLIITSGAIQDRYKVQDYYRYERAKIERVELADGTTVLDSDDFAGAPIRGTISNDRLQGNDDSTEHFDADAGGDDYLYGKSGDDIYWLRRGTGNDRIVEKHYMRLSSGDTGDVIRLGAGLTVVDARLWRDTNHLYVALTVPSGLMRDRYQVEDYYRYEKAKIERVELFDGTTVFDSEDFAVAPVRGSASSDRLQGNDGAADHFDADAGGDDYLYGKGGDDVYWLRRGTGNDWIVEKHYMRLSAGDTGDVIRLGAGLTVDDVRIWRDTNHLYVALTVPSGSMRDRYQVEDYYRYEKAKIERVELSDGTTVLDSEDFAVAPVRGSASNDRLQGNDGAADHFDADAGGDDYLYGKGGDDVYWLRRGTGNDRIVEKHYMRLDSGDSGDVIRLGAGLAVDDVRIWRDTDHLYVALTVPSGLIRDRYQVENYYRYEKAKIERVELSDGTMVLDSDDFAVAPIRGSASDDRLQGNDDAPDHFDADAGGDDYLYGKSGDDVYWLRRGTGNDRIVEKHYMRLDSGDSGDVIRLGAGLTADDVHLSRDADHLYISLEVTSGTMRDRYLVQDHYRYEKARIERVELSDGTTVLDSDDFAAVLIRGTASNDQLWGKHGVSDSFDADAGGNDRLYGKGGNDIYWLGVGTGRDVIFERYMNPRGDSADRIKVENGFDAHNVEFRREGSHLTVKLFDSSNMFVGSLRIDSFYTYTASRVEHVEAGGRTFSTSRADAYITASRDFESDSASSEYDTLQALIDDYWI